MAIFGDLDGPKKPDFQILAFRVDFAHFLVKIRKILQICDFFGNYAFCRDFEDFRNLWTFLFNNPDFSGFLVFWGILKVDLLCEFGSLEFGSGRVEEGGLEAACLIFADLFDQS